MWRSEEEARSLRRYFVQLSGTLNETYSFVPFWRLNFISKVTAEDRYHLHRLTLDTARTVRRSDVNDARYDRRQYGGFVIDISTNEVVCEERSMPYSPCLYQN